MENYTDLEIAEIQKWFSTFAENECKGNAALYYKLCQNISNDLELPKMAAFSKRGQPIPNIFLGAIHYLLLKDKKEELANFYPTISKKSNISEIPFELFKLFCLRNEIEIKNIISTRIVQTNVVSRCAYLFPLISKILETEDKPTTIVDIGTSAGLTLNFDKYEYWLNDQKVYGNSKVKIKSIIKEGKIKEINPIKNKLTKIGIDQNVILPSNTEDKLWLKALVWADHLERFENMDNSLQREDLKDIQFKSGKTIIDFQKILDKIPKEENLIIYATHTLYQFNLEERAQFFDLFDRLSKERDFYFISAEGIRSQLEKYNTRNTVVELLTYKNGQKNEELIAETNGHGNWVSWKQKYLD